MAGGGEALLTADVLPQYGGEEVFHAGGPVQPSSTPGRVTCLNGRTGDTIWTRSIVGIGDTATIQMADIDKDGRLEIVVTLQHPAGLYILNAEDGSTLWRAPGTYNGNQGYITPIGGRIDGSGVAGDADGNGNLDLFIGVMAYEEQPQTGKLIRYEWDPSQQTMVERVRITVWHPCAGGLSLGDTDNDGTIELYMNERDVYFGDGSWGRGLTSFWASNLTKRWSVYDWGASSNIPMLADVNRDGIVDVVSTNLGTGVCVLNSTNGHPLTNAQGTVLYNQRLSLPVHYQSSIYDIDGDGSLELLCADGQEGGYTEVRIWDLYNWQLDGIISNVICFRGPGIGEVTGDGIMDIVVVTFDKATTSNNGSVQIYNRNLQLLDSHAGLQHRAIGSVIQDVDRNDNGLNELLVLTQGGVIYCFDTPGLSQERLGNPRPRSEIHFYSESRNGVSEYIPYERPWPDVSSPNPSIGVLNVSTGTNQLSFRLNHPLGQTMSYTVTTTPNIGSGSGNNVGNGVRTVPVSGLKASTQYIWQVNVTDQSGHKTSKDYWFITAPYITNTAPTHGTPLLNSTNGGNTVNEDLSCYNQTTADINGDTITNIYNWYKNNAAMANLNLPFNTKPDDEAVYSGNAVTRDYSGRGNNGTVFGATWVPDGVVGGALSFDGNDFVRIEEQGNSLGGSGTWTQMSIEFWIKAPIAGSAKRLIWKPDRYYTRTVNSYRIDVRNNASQQLEFTWYISSGANTYSLSYNQSSGVTDWHHVVCAYKSGSGLKIYVDGEQRAVNSSSAISGNVNATNGPVQIAFNRGPNDFVGFLDEVRIYPTELSATMVSQRYNETRNGLSNKSTIPSSETAIGDRWQCQVTPNDGLADGTTRNSNTIQVGSGPTQQYSLTVNVQGSGTTNPATGTYQYDSGSVVSVAATAGSGYKFSYWLLDSANVGSANPYSVTMNANHILTAVFVPQTPTEHIFADGFESGNFNAWTGTTTTSGGSATVVSSLPHSGTYSARFTINSGSGARRAYSYQNLDNLNELYAYAYVYIADGLPLSSGQSMWLIQFEGPVGTVLASFGIRADASGSRWAVQYSNYPYAIGTSSPSEGQWYLLEAYYTHASTGKTIVLTVNGAEVASLSQNTATTNNIVRARFGVGYYVGSSTATVYVDDVTIDAQVTPPTLYDVSLQSEENNALSSNLGSITCDGVNYALPSVAAKADGTYAVTYSAASGYAFNHWVTTGSVSVANANAQSTTMTVSGNGSLKAVYSSAPTQYTLHVQVSGSGVTNATGDTSYNQGTVVNVQATASSGWTLSYWLLDNNNVGSANPYAVTMNTNHNLTAVFTAVPSEHLFEDGFESGNFAAWTGTTTTSGGSANVVSSLPHSGSYSGQFNVNAGSGTRRAYVYTNLNNQPELYARAYVYIADGLPLASGQNMWLIQFEDSGGSVLASFGVRADSSGTRWAVQYSNYPYALGTSGPSEGQWYLLEAYYTHAATGKTIVLTVDGVEVASLSQNTAATNNIARVRFGLGYYAGSSTASVYIDDVTIDS